MSDDPAWEGDIIAVQAELIVKLRLELSTLRGEKEKAEANLAVVTTMLEEEAYIRNEAQAELERLKLAARLAMRHVPRDSKGYPDSYFEELERLLDG
jgi:hypothetical protein